MPAEAPDDGGLRGLPEPMIRGFARQFGHNLNRARLREGLGKEDVASSMSVDRSAVEAVEGGELLPRLDTALALAAALNAALADLTAGIVWDPDAQKTGDFTFSEYRAQWAHALEGAAAFRASQTEVVDAAQLVRESREDLERRGERLDRLLREGTTARSSSPFPEWWDIGADVIVAVAGLSALGGQLGRPGLLVGALLGVLWGARSLLKRGLRRWKLRRM
jgi:DNA-binding XRE family transcriptional regulator